jgi:hypothetical protein|tara:strand:+ start:99 stop:521 length:423 start_codon:yes stop_codon:yes gene_type:complete
MKKDQKESPSAENVIKGPWKARGKKEVVIPDVDVIALQENIMFADDLTESCLVQMIHTMGENGIDIGEKEFVRDIGFVIESVKSTIYRDMGVGHPMNKIMEMLTKINVDEKNSMNSQVDLELLEKVEIVESDIDEEPEPA